MRGDSLTVYVYLLLEITLRLLDSAPRSEII